LEDLGVDGRLMLEKILEKQGEKIWIGFMWIKVGFNDGLL